MTDEQRLLNEKYGGRSKAALGADAGRYEADMERLAGGEPLAYVIGWQPFLGLRICLDSKPLIPRPETEWITEKLIAQHGRQGSFLGGESSNTLQGALPSVPSLRLLDLCAGSGAIGCALLAKIPNARVSFGELMPEHEATIRRNISENNLDAARADIRIGNLFAPFTASPGARGAAVSAPEKFDTIVSNPPYIPDGRTLDSSVVQFEPAEALRGGLDGLGIIRRIAAEAGDHLNPGGELWLEIDAPAANEALVLVEAALGSAELYPDPYGRPRLIVAHYDQ